MNTLRSAAGKKRDLWIWSGLAVALALAGGTGHWELAAAPAVAAIMLAAQRLRTGRRKAAIENRMARSLAALIVKVGEGGSEPALAGRPRVLVADDHLANGEVASHILTGLGARVDLTSNGREAIERMRTAAYDLVLMDCQMPEMTGPEAVEKIRRAEGSEWHTPIIAMTTGTGAGLRSALPELWDGRSPGKTDAQGEYGTGLGALGGGDRRAGYCDRRRGEHLRFMRRLRLEPPLRR